MSISLIYIYFIVFNCESSVAEESDSFGKQLPLGFFHNSFLKSFGSVILLHFNSLLKNNWSCVAFGGYYMNSRSRYLDALFKRCLVNVKSIVSLAAE